MVNKREIMINGRLYEVTNLEDYSKNPDAYLSGYTAIDIGQKRIYPVVPTTSPNPGIMFRSTSPFSYIREPDPEDTQYDRENIIDFTDVKSYKEFIEKQNMVRDLERDILTTPDNVYVPPEDSNDTPAMKALKEAVTDKHIDLDKYEPRFGSNYNNDKRIFNKPNISLPMLVRMCNALDIKATLTLEDQVMEDGSETPNPIGKVITVELTSKQNNAEE